MKAFKALLVVIVVLIFAGVIYLYSGAYNIGTDVPHAGITHWFLSTLRNRSISTHAKGNKVPPLETPQILAAGARNYQSLCSGCHLAPGMPDTEIRQGLYPAPPDLSKHKPIDPAKAFWIIKHGIKFTAMPAWGPTHDDPAIWSIVAFLEKLPSMSAEQYSATIHSDDDEIIPQQSAPGVTTPAAPASSAAAPKTQEQVKLATPQSAAPAAAASSQKNAPPL